MSSSAPAPTAARRSRSTLLATLVVVSAPFTGVLLARSPASPSASGAPPAAFHDAGPPAASDTAPDGTTPPGAPDGHDGRPLLPQLPGEEDGVVADGGVGTQSDVPAVVELDAALLGALRSAAAGAAEDGVEILVTSGWRSREYQEHLLREAVAEHGSEEEAARWVATPETSAHVSGDAVDVGPDEATAWLSAHGAAHGLCQIYRNEPWHFELRPRAGEHGCPAMYADPRQDPRMQR